MRRSVTDLHLIACWHPKLHSIAMLITQKTLRAIGIRDRKLEIGNEKDKKNTTRKNANRCKYFHDTVYGSEITAVSASASLHNAPLHTIPRKKFTSCFYLRRFLFRNLVLFLSHRLLHPSFAWFEDNTTIWIQRRTYLTNSSNIYLEHTPCFLMISERWACMQFRARQIRKISPGVYSMHFISSF